jgi:hypothetical protein
VQAFFVKDHGDFEAAVFHEKLLDGIGQLGHRSGIFASSRVARPSDLSESKALLEVSFSLLQVKVAVFIQHGTAFLLPDAQHLSRFFLERHACNEVPRTAFCGQFWI